MGGRMNPGCVTHWDSDLYMYLYGMAYINQKKLNNEDLDIWLLDKLILYIQYMLLERR